MNLKKLASSSHLAVMIFPLLNQLKIDIIQIQNFGCNSWIFYTFTPKACFKASCETLFFLLLRDKLE